MSRGLTLRFGATPGLPDSASALTEQLQDESAESWWCSLEGMQVDR